MQWLVEMWPDSQHVLFAAVHFAQHGEYQRAPHDVLIMGETFIIARQIERDMPMAAAPPCQLRRGDSSSRACERPDSTVMRAAHGPGSRVRAPMEDSMSNSPVWSILSAIVAEFFDKHLWSPWSFAFS